MSYSAAQRARQKPDSRTGQRSSPGQTGHQRAVLAAARTGSLVLHRNLPALWAYRTALRYLPD